MTTEMASWHKSSYSGSASDCVEVAEGKTVLVRDTKHRGLGHIAYPADAWSAFLHELKTNRF